MQRQFIEMTGAQGPGQSVYRFMSSIHLKASSSLTRPK